MKLLSLNSHSLVEEDWEIKMEEIAWKIHKEAYDVIAFQEVNQTMSEKEADAAELERSRYVAADENTGIRIDNFAFRLVANLQKLGDTYYWTYAISHIGYERYEEGLALLSREPFLATQSIVVSRETDRTSPETRRQIGADICIRKQRMKFYSVHFGWWKKGEEYFAEQWDNFIRKINLSEADIAYILGDFNNPAQVRGEGYDYIMKDIRWNDAYSLSRDGSSGVTTLGGIDGWKNELQGKRIDFIIKNKSFGEGTFGTVFDDVNGAVVSDHFGIELTIR